MDSPPFPFPIPTQSASPLQTADVPEPSVPVVSNTGSNVNVNHGVESSSTLESKVSQNKRKEMRASLQKGNVIPRLNKRKAEFTYVPLSAAELVTVTAKLDRATRWNTFLTHTNLNAHEIIEAVTSGRVDVDSADFNTLRSKLQENVRSYKNNVLKNMEIFLEDMFGKDKGLVDSSDSTFQIKFGESFNQQNYLFVFYYIKNYVNFDGSSDLGRWYTESMSSFYILATLRY